MTIASTPAGPCARIARPLGDPRLLLALVLASAASAQTAPRPPAGAAGEQVVTLSEFDVSVAQDKGYMAGNSVSGTRINTPIKELPFAVNAFTQQFISDVGARDLGDIVQYAPGVTSAAKQIVQGDASYMIRGFQQAPQINGFATPNSSVTGGSFIDSVAIKRVEVVKGPASLLYGQVAPGGTVNYITKEAEEKPFLSVAARAGSYDYWRTTVDANQPLAPGRLLFRVNAAYEGGLRYVKPSKSRTAVLAPTLTWKITDRLLLDVNYQQLERREDPPAEFKPQMEIVAAPPTSGASAGVLGTTGVLQNPLDLSDPGFLEYYPLPKNYNFLSSHDSRFTHFETLAAELNAKLGDHWSARANVSSNRGYNRFKQTGLTSVDLDVPASFTSQYPTYAAAAAAYAAALLKNPNLAFLAPHQQLGRRQAQRETFGHSAALQAEVLGEFDWLGGEVRPLAGIYYDAGKAYDRRRQTGSNGTFTVFTAPTAAAKASQLPPWDFANPALFPIATDTDFNPNALPLTTYTGTHTHTKAAYALLNGRFLGGRLVAVAGLRWNESDTSVTNFLTDPTVVNPLNPTFTPAVRAHKVTPQVAAGYKLAPDLLLYASFSESYQANSFLKAGTVPGVTAKPTTSKGEEVGLKADLLEGRVSSTVAVYRIDQKDRIISLNVATPTAGTQSFDFQGTLDRSNGIEADLNYSPRDDWQIYASVAEDDVRTIAAGPGLGVYLGTHPQSSAKTLANLWTRYNFTLPALRSLWVGGGVNYTSHKAGIVTNAAVVLPTATIWHLASGYDWKWGATAMSAQLNWDNITNVEYFPTIQDRGLPARASLTLTATF